MAGLLVLTHENICQISSRGPVFRPQVKGLHECFFPTVLARLSPTSRPWLDYIPKLFCISFNLNQRQNALSLARIIKLTSLPSR